MGIGWHKYGSAIGSDSKNNATATVTVATPGAGYRLIVDWISASFDVLTVARVLLTVADSDGTVLYKDYVDTTVGCRIVPVQIPVTPNKGVVVTLAASGTPGRTGYLYVHTFKENG